MQLYHQRYPHPDDNDCQRPVIIIPGLFGLTVNWHSFAKELAEQRSVIVIDQRNHGRSPHAPSQSYLDMADDLLQFIQQNQIEQALLCGHSMGGKVAMLFALLYPQQLEKLIVLDIAPVDYQHSHAPFLEALLEIDLSQLKSRSEADRALYDTIPDTATRLFLLQSLTGSPGQYSWRLNLPVLHQYMPQLMAFQDELTEGKNYQGEMTLIYGGLSNYVQDAHHSKIKALFPKVKFKEIEGAGHWVHVDQPDKVLKEAKAVMQAM